MRVNNKQINKGVAHGGGQIQGVVQHCTVCRVQYAMHQSMQQSFGVDWRWLEMHRAQSAWSYSDITPLLRWSPPVWVPHGGQSGCGGVMMVEVLDDVRGIHYSLSESGHPLNFTR